MDLTLIPGKIGGDVSRAVHDKLVAKLNINDRGFIINYAFVETEFGKNVSFCGGKPEYQFKFRLLTDMIFNSQFGPFPVTNLSKPKNIT